MALAALMLLSACAEAHLGVALAKQANDALGGGAPSAASPATTGPGAAPARAAQPAQSVPEGLDDRALLDGPPMIRDAALFSAEAETLWDGLPSLGGPWVAHPDASRNLVVEAVNLDTGQSMRLPALRLTRRAGRPPIQLSAEAALALGMAPGRLTNVRLTGLRPRPAGYAAPAPAGGVETFDMAAPAAPMPMPAPAAEAPRIAAPAVRPDLAAAAPAPAPADAALAALSPAASPAPSRRPGAAAQPGAAPYVQIGAFGQAANAEAAAAMFRARGLAVSELRAGRLRRVLLGPFDNLAAARDARALAAHNGFADAYVTVQ